jgi:hypothetical protein
MPFKAKGKQASEQERESESEEILKERRDQAGVKIFLYSLTKPILLGSGVGIAETGRVMLRQGKAKMTTDN